MQQQNGRPRARATGSLSSAPSTSSGSGSASQQQQPAIGQPRRRAAGGATSAGSGSDSRTATPLRLTSHLPYPLTITRLHASALSPSSPESAAAVASTSAASSQVRKTGSLLTFAYQRPVVTTPPGDDIESKKKKDAKEQQRGEEMETAFSTWESPIEGQVIEWLIKPGDVVRDARQVVVRILEPCTHDVQLAGLCALCGKDLTSSDYTGFSDTSRANIRMTHDQGDLTVSLEEARRLEEQTTTRLRQEQKLSLIVDLDQTIVHATVDPTVGEWMREDAELDAQEAHDNAHDNDEGATSHGDDNAGQQDSSSSSEGVTRQVRPTRKRRIRRNPNAEALRDVGRFKLGTSGEQVAEEDTDGCTYYIKMRPGLASFLAEMDKSYEMHVYTMGTRAYASAVCKLIDPDGALFGERILTRDESGSLTLKSLERLFPCDTSMVVVIDDRGDVWDWSPNLVKVIPYDFFVGIGDINAAYLPKKRDLAAAIAPGAAGATKKRRASASAVSSSSSESGASSSSPEGAATTTSATTSSSDGGKRDANADIEVSASGSGGAGDDEASLGMAPSRSAAAAETAHTLEAQVAERPLARMLDAQVTAQAQQSETNEQNQQQRDVAMDGGADESEPLDESSANASDEDEHAGVPVLRDDDRELDRLSKVLKEIHKHYYEATSLEEQDVKSIIPSMKRRVLSGTNVLFSSMIPLHVKPHESEPWRAARVFGARCFNEFSRAVTHVVTNQDNTNKVHAARRRGDVHVVWAQWLLDSIDHWERMPESSYYLDGIAARPSQSEPASTVATPGDLRSSGAESDDDGKVDIDAIASEVDEEMAAERAQEEAAAAEVDFAKVDWGDAAKEIEDLMDDGSTEDDDDDDEGDADADEDDAGTDASVDSSPFKAGEKSSPAAPRSNSKKRVRTSSSDAPATARPQKHAATTSDSDNDSEETSSLSSKANKAAMEGTGSPLSKRQKLARRRSSALKFETTRSSAASSSSEGDKKAIEKPKPASRALSRRGSVASSRGGGGTGTDDDDDFLTSLAADVEAQWAENE